MTTASNSSSPPRIALPLLRSGKVRDVYELPAAASNGSGGDTGPLLLVASDRISAFDVIMPTPIAGKGKLLTQMSTFWFNFIRARKICEVHVLGTSLSDLPRDVAPPGSPQAEYLDGRITIGRRCEVIPIECVVRGYLEGSGWKEYQQTQSVCGVALPPGLKQCSKLPEPIFTPATKAAEGHDENITFEQACDALGAEGLETMSFLRDTSIAIYNAAAAHALARGIIIADTKFEFGIPHDISGTPGSMKAARVWQPPILIDEALTPDSSRFWPADSYEPGRAQRSFDKQFLREYLEGLVADGAWHKTPPGPALPEHVVKATLAKYQEAYERLAS